MFFAALKVSWKEECCFHPMLDYFCQTTQTCWSFIKWQKSNPFQSKLNVCSPAANRKTSAMCHVLCSKGTELGSLKADTLFVAMTVMVI